MSDNASIPVFPLTLLPLPGEMVPLHIFEPRYRQLLADAETADITFGIFLHHECNEKQLGSLMKLETVLKRYQAGESDIVVRCIGIFSMEQFYQNYNEKLYPGGDVINWQIDPQPMPGVKLYDMFLQFQKKKGASLHAPFSLYQIASALSLNVSARYKFLTLPTEKKEGFLINHLKLELHVIRREEESREVYHLN